MASTLLLLVALPLALCGSVPAWSIGRHEWHSLNSTVGGRLHTATPMSLPCFSNYDGQPIDRNQTECSIIQANYRKPEFLVQIFGNVMMTEFETCQTTGERCLLDNSNTNNSLAWTNATCSQGSIPPYYIELGGADDVIAAFDFSKKTGVSLIIKNTGHDYKGRSSRKGALALWTHNLTGLSYSSDFVPEGCSTSITYPAMTLGAGETFNSVYAFADANNITFIGGYHETVGASGGWVMGAGHSVLSPVYGLGVDRVVQFKVVTPDGVFRIANECQHPDLYFALRGGGGGTFGVVLETTHVVEPRRMPLQVASISFTANGTASQAGWLDLLLKNSYRWAQEGWGGHMGASSLINVTPLLTLEQANASMADAAAYARAHNGSVTVKTLSVFYEFYEQYVLENESGVGYDLVMASRLMPASLFQNATGQEAILSLLTSYLPSNPSIIMTTPYLFNGSYGGGKTSTTPAWYDAIWHLLPSSGTSPAYNATTSVLVTDYELRRNVTEALQAIAPDSGAYINEGDLYQSDHEKTFWGEENYKKLLEIKHKYDPEHILDCWQCVGWKGQADPDFACYPTISN